MIEYIRNIGWGGKTKYCKAIKKGEKRKRQEVEPNDDP